MQKRKSPQARGRAAERQAVKKAGGGRAVAKAAYGNPATQAPQRRPAASQAAQDYDEQPQDQVRFTKLRQGDWALRGYGLQPHYIYTVTRRDGSTVEAVSGRVLWEDPEGSGLTLALIAEVRNDKSDNDLPF